ncbi:hypothetical protein ACJMK2_013280, partial [Sinanodonta woodiana]
TGHIRIRSRSYDLRPEEWEVTSSGFMEDLGHLGKRYVLQDLHPIYSLDSKEQSNLNKKIIEQERNTQIRSVRDQHNQNQFTDPEALISSKNRNAIDYRQPV